MWYTVLKQELTMQESFAGTTYKIPAGTVMTAEKYPQGKMMFVKFTDIDEPRRYGDVFLTQAQAGDYFTKPVKELNAAYEESFMVCEAAYC